jgi:serine phosphatase RsbU (regulator of sigma subunit)
VTAAYLYIDLTKKKMAYAAAGHPPLLWFQKLGDKTCALEENGLLLGVAASAQYSSVEKDITPAHESLLTAIPFLHHVFENSYEWQRQERNRAT